MATISKNTLQYNRAVRLVGKDGRFTGQGWNAVEPLFELADAVTIEDGEVTTAKIAADAVTADKISVTSLEAVSATLGNVVVDGDLIVNGTLTTSKHEADSISDAVYAFTSGNTGLNPGHGTKVLQTVTLTTVGGRVSLRGSFDAVQTGYFEAPIVIGLNRDGSGIIGTAKWHTANWNGSAWTGRSHQYFVDFEDEDASAGEHTYTMVGISTTADFTVGGRYLSCREQKTEDVS